MVLRILQFGRSGQVGAELLSRAIARGHDIAALGRDIIDLAQPDRIRWAVTAAGNIDIVINGAAYTAVDKAESEPERADLVNGDAVGVLAEICAKRGLPLIHLSTDYVFDGAKPAPYNEDDPTAPLNAYGRSKLKGELLLRARHREHIILRTSWIYSAHGRNFVKTILKRAAETDELRIVDDQIGSPTSAGDIAETCLALCEHIIERRRQTPWGTYHYAAQGFISWRQFAEAIIDETAAWADLKARIIAIPSTEYPAAAQRPLNSRLDCGRIATAFGIRGRPWRNALREVLEQIRTQGAGSP